MFTLVKTAEPIVVNRVKVLIYGEGGAGKTSLANTANNPITLDFDDGSYRSAYRKDVIRMTSWSDIADNAPAFMAAIKNYDTVIIDTVQTALDLLGAYIIQKNPKLGYNKLQWYGRLGDDFKAFVDGINSLGKDVIMTAHVKEKEEGDVRIKRPAVAGQTYNNIIQISDFVGYMFFKDNSRTINFSPTDFSHGKNSADIPITAIPNFAENGKYMSELLQTMKDSINRLSAVQRESAEAIDKINDVISSLSDAEELNDYMDYSKDQPKSLKLQIFNKLKDRAIAIGSEYDAKAKKFMAMNLEELCLESA